MIEQRSSVFNRLDNLLSCARKSVSAPMIGGEAKGEETKYDEKSYSEWSSGVDKVCEFFLEKIDDPATFHQLKNKPLVEKLLEKAEFFACEGDLTAEKAREIYKKIIEHGFERSLSTISCKFYDSKEQIPLVKLLYHSSCKSKGRGELYEIENDGSDIGAIKLIQEWLKHGILSIEKGAEENGSTLYTLGRALRFAEVRKLDGFFDQLHRYITESYTPQEQTDILLTSGGEQALLAANSLLKEPLDGVKASIKKESGKAAPSLTLSFWDLKLFYSKWESKSDEMTAFLSMIARHCPSVRIEIEENLTPRTAQALTSLFSTMTKSISQIAIRFSPLTNENMIKRAPSLASLAPSTSIEEAPAAIDNFCLTHRAEVALSKEPALLFLELLRQTQNIEALEIDGSGCSYLDGEFFQRLLELPPLHEEGKVKSIAFRRCFSAHYTFFLLLLEKTKDSLQTITIDDCGLIDERVKNRIIHSEKIKRLVLNERVPRRFSSHNPLSVTKLQCPVIRGVEIELQKVKGKEKIACLVTFADEKALLDQWQRGSSAIKELFIHLHRYNPRLHLQCSLSLSQEGCALIEELLTPFFPLQIEKFSIIFPSNGEMASNSEKDSEAVDLELAKPYQRLFSTLHNITSLYIDGGDSSYLTDEVLLAIIENSPALTNQTLETLAFDNCELVDQKAIISLIERAGKNLRQLKVHHCRYIDGELAKAIAENCRELEAFSLCSRSLGIESGDFTKEEALHMVASCEKLEKLFFYNSELACENRQNRGVIPWLEEASGRHFSTCDELYENPFRLDKKIIAADQ